MFEGITDGKINCPEIFTEIFIMNKVICMSLDRRKCVKDAEF